MTVITVNQMLCEILMILENILPPSGNHLLEAILSIKKKS